MKTRRIEKWYDKKYTEMGGGWECPPEEAHRLIEWAEIEKDPMKKLIDVGCGEGHFINVAQEYVFCIGIDLSGVICEMAYKKFEFRPFIIQRQNIEETPFANSHFDYVTSIGSIEHVENIDRALAQCYRILKKGGKFLCLVPNELWTHKDQPSEQTHTDEEWLELFKNAGFKLIKKNRRNDLTDFLLKK